MINLERAFAEAGINQLNIGNFNFTLVLPYHGNIPLRVKSANVDPNDRKMVPQCDAAGNRESQLLSQDWYYFSSDAEEIVGYLSLNLRAYGPASCDDLLQAKNLSASISSRYKLRAEQSLQRAIEGAEWQGLAAPTESNFIYPEQNDFSQKCFSGQQFLFAEVGDSTQEFLLPMYFLGIDDNNYVSFQFTASGFSSGLSDQALITSLTDDFMHRIKITTDHPVSA